MAMHIHDDPAVGRAVTVRQITDRHLHVGRVRRYSSSCGDTLSELEKSCEREHHRQEQPERKVPSPRRRYHLRACYTLWHMRPLSSDTILILFLCHTLFCLASPGIDLNQSHLSGHPAMQGPTAAIQA